jgi:hypothetical protein
MIYLKNCSATNTNFIVFTLTRPMNYCTTRWAYECTWNVSWTLNKRSMSLFHVWSICFYFRPPGHHAEANTDLHSQPLNIEHKLTFGRFKHTYLLTLYFCWAYLAAIPTLLNMQNPIIVLASAWWPGGLK